jgi:hypothetical protein
MNSINELYQQYEKSIALQTEIIASCRRDLDKARKTHKNKQAAELTRYLRILYEEKNEMMLNAHELRKYIEATQS